MIGAVANKPSIGRIVHYLTPEGVHLPAIVTAATGDICDLIVFSPRKPAYPVPDVRHAEPVMTPDTWHWPEREGEP